jgi:hypothetical protein
MEGAFIKASSPSELEKSDPGFRGSRIQVIALQRFNYVFRVFVKVASPENASDNALVHEFLVQRNLDYTVTARLETERKKEKAGLCLFLLPIKQPFAIHRLPESQFLSLSLIGSACKLVPIKIITGTSSST